MDRYTAPIVIEIITLQKIAISKSRIIKKLKYARPPVRRAAAANFQIKLRNRFEILNNLGQTKNENKIDQKTPLTPVKTSRAKDQKTGEKSVGKNWRKIN